MKLAGAVYLVWLGFQALRSAGDSVDPAGGVAAASLRRVFVGVSLAVDDVRARHEALVARGVRFLEPPTQQPWGAMMAHFEFWDPVQDLWDSLVAKFRGAVNPASNNQFVFDRHERESLISQEPTNTSQQDEPI